MKHHMDGEHREGVEECALALAAIQAMTDADAIGRGCNRDPHGSAQAATGVVSHGAESTCPGPALAR